VEEHLRGQGCREEFPPLFPRAEILPKEVLFQREIPDGGNASAKISGFPVRVELPTARGTVVPIALRIRPCRTALNRSSISAYTLNCYGGCMHGCVYCYARYMERVYPHSEPWGDYVDIKLGILEALWRQLRRLPPGKVFLSSACDGWQPVEAQFALTRKAAELLLQHGFSLQILTKSDLILRDLPLFVDRPVKVGVSVSCVDDRLAELWEPRAAPPSVRFDVVAKAHQMGIKAVVMFAPVLPFLSDSPSQVEAVLVKSAEMGASEIWVDSFNFRPKVWESVRRLLREHFPELERRYRELVFDEKTYARYRDSLRNRIVAVTRRVGLSELVQLCF